ncbi:FkbM family methyltransferase [Herbaspirillum sp. AP02]|uniref:FkbM family methyltransferase n=1 Tax=unclassified Herbaspirillum TaxID=2624150 RepID=UPI0015D9E8EB|nr:MULTISPECIES: FkbM family methyltransferase [unclassified Herbaspirillum]MBG7620977.1 FkbM family methyltransferase [Herbaspirillum sp. AP02]NZD68440.1 FkbM family methyltransferase [Herbaspirillum sp. AP21]
MFKGIDAAGMHAADLQADTDYFLSIARPDGGAVVLPFRLGEQRLSECGEHVVLAQREKFELLRQLHRYPEVLALADANRPAACATLEAALAGVFSADRGLYIFGAHKLGAKVARFCAERGIVVKGFIDNSRDKHGKRIDGILIGGPDQIDGENETVVVASGRYSNVIMAQLHGLGWKHVKNMHELMFALRTSHNAESDFRSFVDALDTDAMRFISAFLALDDERSRQIFDGLIRMRRTLDTQVADSIKSPFADEYLDADFIRPADMAYYVDAGAFNGDSLERMEQRLGKATHAYLFEPELPAYYDGLKRHADRPEVFFYNLGLSSSYQKFTYRPAMSFDLLQEIDSPIPNDIVSYIQTIRLDDIITGPVTLFKLDIEGAEEEALKGAAGTIRVQRPKLCVCAYHRASDLWKLLDEVKHIHPDYKVGLRHYSDIMDDSSFYFY